MVLSELWTVTQEEMNFLTEAANMAEFAKKNKDVVEFYVDRTKIPAGVNGNYNRLEPFHGKIQSIEQLTEWDRAEA